MYKNLKVVAIAKRKLQELIQRESIINYTM